MIEYLDDSHTSIYAPDLDLEHVSGSGADSITEAQFSFEVIRQHYVDDYRPVKGVPNDLEFGYGEVRGKDIGYLYMNAMAGSDPERIDDVVAALRDKQAIIVDIRNNLGGDDPFAARDCRRFCRRSTFYLQRRNTQWA